jgi:putative tricarboxylic transport membrane protein
MTAMIRDVAAGLVLLALSVAYYLAADAMPRSILDTTVNSSAFPKLLAVAGALFSIALIAQGAASGLMARRGGAAARTPLWSPQNRRALGLLAVIAAFVAAFEWVGYPAAVALVILAISRYQGHPLSKTSLAVAIGGALLFWAFFVLFLKVRMPVGFWRHLADLPAFVLPV